MIPNTHRTDQSEKSTLIWTVHCQGTMWKPLQYPTSPSGRDDERSFCILRIYGVSHEGARFWYGRTPVTISRQVLRAPPGLSLTIWTLERCDMDPGGYDRLWNHVITMRSLHSQPRNCSRRLSAAVEAAMMLGYKNGFCRSISYISRHLPFWDVGHLCHIL